jgi:hypothetical protein
VESETKCRGAICIISRILLRALVLNKPRLLGVPFSLSRMYIRPNFRMRSLSMEGSHLNNLCPVEWKVSIPRCQWSNLCSVDRKKILFVSPGRTCPRIFVCEASHGRMSFEQFVLSRLEDDPAILSAGCPSPRFSYGKISVEQSVLSRSEGDPFRVTYMPPHFRTRSLRMEGFHWNNLCSVEWKMSASLSCSPDAQPPAFSYAKPKYERISVE